MCEPGSSVHDTANSLDGGGEEILRRVREWGIQRPLSARNSAWRWAFKYASPPRHDPAGYEHQALCSLCLQAQDLEKATIKLGKNCTHALIQHLRRMHPVAYAEYAALHAQRKKPVKKEKNPVKNPRGRPVGWRQNPIAVQVRLASSAHGGDPSAFQLT